jgi:hypothetical protein
MSATGVEADAESEDPALFRAALGIATLVLMALSWPLWIDASDGYPRVPFLRGWPTLSIDVSFWVFGVTLAAIGLSAAGVGGRLGLLAAACLTTFLVLGDQARLQIWIYQYLWCALALAMAPVGWRLRLCRWFVVALYVHSGLSKLDASFVHELGRVLLDAGLRPLGQSSATWPAALRTAAILAMPTFEMTVGLLLTIRRMRRVGLAGSILLHVAILAVLGPWSLNHSAVVLAWNLALIPENLVLFAPRPESSAPSPREIRQMPAAAWLALVASLLPLAERAGWWDTWPSFAVYASHNERLTVFVHEDDVPRLPANVRRYVLATEGASWQPLDLTAWSRAARGAPPYPQVRAGLGAALAIEQRHAPARGLRARLQHRADPLRGTRRVEWLAGRGAIARQADSYWINAHPAADPQADGQWRTSLSK